MVAGSESVVTNPTYMGDIRQFFEQIDIDHMAAKNIDLGSYAGVKKNALAIYAHTTQPGGDMPPEVERRWSAERSQTFRNWILAHYPLGAAVASTGPELRAMADSGGRVRKDISNLSTAELDLLTTAFKGIMALPITDPNSYYAIASVHGLPQTYCLHHEDRYNPWHRVYLKVMEDALRSIAGCQDVTLPYWDLTTPIPAILQSAPFASYTVPVTLTDPPPPKPPYAKPYKTSRYDQSTIDSLLKRYRVFDYLNHAMTQSMWGVSGISGYQDDIINAHDGGHLSIGPTMADQNVASYDPIFWFYHCNLDRLWLDWQKKVGATTLATFKSTLDGNTGWLEAPFNDLPPYATTADETIAFEGITYGAPVVAQPSTLFQNRFGSIEAVRAFKTTRAAPVSVMVKNIDRLNIPGSFVVTLLADGEPIGIRPFFQPNSPRDCDNCRKLGLISVNFRVDMEQILDRKLSVSIEVPSHTEEGVGFPLSAVGNPTINARLLLEDA